MGGTAERRRKGSRLNKAREFARRVTEAASDDGDAPVRGIMSVVGGFLIQLTLGSYYSFANIMPYMVSYMRKYSEEAVVVGGAYGTSDSAAIDSTAYIDGTSINGTAVNGTVVNGTSINGTAVNGTVVNGTSINGTAVSGTVANGTEGLTYADFIVVQSAWGIAQGCVLPIAGALVAHIGPGKAVLLGSLMFSAAPVLTSVTVSTSLVNVVASYGVLSSVGQNLAILPTLTLPMAWFPHRRGLVAGAVVSGFGAGAFVFNQLQTALANPGNHPVAADGYFAEEEVLAAVPGLLVTLGATYAALLALGAALLLQRAPARRQCRLGVEVMCRRVAAVAAGTVGRRENEEGNFRSGEGKRKASPLGVLRRSCRCCCGGGGGGGSPGEVGGPSSLSGLWLVLRRRETHLLWLTRFGAVLISQGLSGLYKAFALEDLGYPDDFLARVGAVAGVFNCLGRIVFGVLLDRVSYKKLMFVESALLASLLAPFYWLSRLCPYAFAAALCSCYFCLSGTFSMHPAICGRIFGPGLEFVAIGLVGSSDVANNLLIGLFSSEVLGLFGWPGYFVCLSSLCILIVAVTAVFPNRHIKIRRLKKEEGNSVVTSANDKGTGIEQ